VSSESSSDPEPTLKSRVHRWRPAPRALAWVLSAVVAAALLDIALVAPNVQPAAATGSAYAATATRPAPASRLRAQPAPGVPAPAPLRARVARTAAAPRASTRPDPWRWFGFDISWPQCGERTPVLPPPVGSFAIVGLTGGRPLTTNRCLSAEWRWALTRDRRAGYINLSAPPAGVSPESFGATTVSEALSSARAAGVHLTGVWLDVEVGNAWSTDRTVNVAVIAGAATALQAAGLQPGIYSSLLDWHLITGDAAVHVPEWKAVPDGRRLGAGCAEAGFGGRKAHLVQAVFNAGDHNVDGSAQCTLTPDLTRLLG
jgi:hypothetical protein